MKFINALEKATRNYQDKQITSRFITNMKLTSQFFLLFCVLVTQASSQETPKKIDCPAIENKLPAAETGVVLLEGRITEVFKNDVQEELIQFLLSRGMKTENGYFKLVFVADGCEKAVVLTSANPLAFRLHPDDRVRINCQVIRGTLRSYPNPIIIVNEIERVK